MGARVLTLALPLAAIALAGCNHCSNLDKRICADLGADCSVWRSDATLRSMVIPANERRLRVRESTCDALGDDAIYTSRTLPMVRNYIVHLRNPRAPQAVIPMGAPPTSSSGYLTYLLAPLLMLAAFVGSALYRKHALPKAMAQHQANQNATADAQARALAEWQAQQNAQRGNPGDPRG